MPPVRTSVPNSHRHAMQMAAASALALGLCALAMPAAAQSTDGEASSYTWGLGVGAATTQTPYKGYDRENTALPLLHFENRYVRIFGPEAGLKLPGLQLGESQRLDFSVVARYDGSGYEEDDADILEGMRKRKSGFWAGAKAKWSTDLVDVNAQWLADASGNSKGQRFSLGVERTWRFGQHLMLTPRLQATWQDKKYVDYYFGVRDSEARGGRPAYEGKSGVNTEVGVRGIYMFDRRHSLFLDLEVTSLASSIKDSPLVDRSTENRVLVGYLYRFR